jgi:hypothetical protein
VCTFNYLEIYPSTHHSASGVLSYYGSSPRHLRCSTNFPAQLKPLPPAENSLHPMSHLASDRTSPRLCPRQDFGELTTLTRRWLAWGALEIRSMSNEACRTQTVSLHCMYEVRCQSSASSPKGKSSPLHHTLKLLEAHTTNIPSFDFDSAVRFEDHILKHIIRHILS